MVSNDEGSTVCIVLDRMPDSQQKRHSLVVRPSYRVVDLLDDIKRQYQYDAFDLTFTTTKDAEPIVLNNHKGKTLREAGLKFTPEYRNTLMIDRPGTATTTSDSDQSIVKKKKKPEAMNLTGVNNNESASSVTGAAVTSKTMNGDSEKVMETQAPNTNTPIDDSNKKMWIPNDVDRDDDLELGASASPTESTSLYSIPIPPNPPALPMYEIGESSNSMDKNEGSNYGQLRKLKTNSLGE